MDFIERIRELSVRLEKRVERVQTEEATKNALVMPFINHVLGYNVFDPTEVVPEFTADVGTKKGEKVDYVIMKDDKPIVLFECKRRGSDLNKEHAAQLYRYFSVTEARFGVLTDGIIYRFYSDLDRPNMMDAKPFLEFNMLDFDEDLIEELKKFSKSSFDLEEILMTASDLKYTREIKRILAEQWSNPSDDFVRFFAPQVYRGRLTKAVMQEFNQITKSAFHQFVSDRISDRLKSALADEQAASLEQKPQEQPISADDGEEEDQGDQRIITTQEELQGYYIVKAILGEVVDIKRVTLRDRMSYCGILLDNNNRKPICRLHFNSPRQKYLGLFDEHKREDRVSIDNIDEIYKHAAKLKATVGYYATG